MSAELPDNLIQKCLSDGMLDKRVKEEVESFIENKINDIVKDIMKKYFTDSYAHDNLMSKICNSLEKIFPSK